MIFPFLVPHVTLSHVQSIMMQITMMVGVIWPSYRNPRTGRSTKRPPPSIPSYGFSCIMIMTTILLPYNNDAVLLVVWPAVQLVRLIMKRVHCLGIASITKVKHWEYYTMAMLTAEAQCDAAGQNIHLDALRWPLLSFQRGTIRVPTSILHLKVSRSATEPWGCQIL